MPTERFSKPLPVFFMGKIAANDRISRFMDSKHVLLSEAMISNLDTKSIWYSFDHIENIYKELVFLNADGLRIYMGQYEDTHPDFPGQLCLVMVPTRLNVMTEGHQDIILEDEVDFEQRPGSEMFLSELSKAYNYGSPCPTICEAEGDSLYPFAE